MKGPRAHQVIDKSHLRMVVLKCALISLAGLAGTAAIFWMIMHRQIGPTYGEGFRMLAELNRDILYKSLIIYGSTVLVTMICIALITLLYSHRVAGPVYRLRQFAGRIGGGDVSGRVTLRQGDVVQPLAGEMNGMNEAFRQTVTGIMQEIEVMEKAAAGEGPPDVPAIREAAARITALIGRYRL
jgi:methyl-accepting chemotaxis protein